MYIYYLTSGNTFGSFKLFTVSYLILQICSVFSLRNMHICVILFTFIWKLMFLTFLKLTNSLHGQDLLNPRSCSSLFSKKSYLPRPGNWFYGRWFAHYPSIDYQFHATCGFLLELTYTGTRCSLKYAINGLLRQTASLGNIWPQTNEISLPKLVAPVFTLLQPVLLCV
jgi:hypothetical protein